jgi:O-antigen/teichoic acid export membrane protein
MTPTCRPGVTSSRSGEDGRGGRRGLARGVVTVAAGNALTPAVAAATTPLFTHVLGVDGQGATAGATAPLLLATVVATLGIPSTLTYAVAKAPTMLSGFFRRALGATVLTGALVTVLVVALSGLLSGHRRYIGQLIVLAAAFILPTLILQAVRASALGLQRWALLAVEQVLGSFVLLGGSVLFLCIGRLDVRTATLLTAGAPLAGFAAYVPLRRALLREGSTYDSEQVHAWRLPQYAGRVWIGGVTGILLARIDQTLMVPLSGAHQLGLYTVAVSVSSVTLLANTAVANVMFAAESAEGNAERLARAGRISTATVLVGGVAIGVAAYFTLGVVFGAGFGHAYPSVLILLAAVVLGNPGSVAGAGLSGRGHPGLRSISLSVAAAVNLALVLLLVPEWGAIGAAAATLVGNLVASNLNLVFLARHERIAVAEFYGIRRSDVSFLWRRTGGQRLATRLRRPSTTS